MSQPTDDQYWAELGARLDQARTDRHLAGDSYQQAWTNALRQVLREPPARLHKQVVDAENAAGRWTDRARAAEREASRLRDLVDLATLRRLKQMLDLITQVGDPARGVRHDEHCWTRHAACLGARIREALEDPLPDGGAAP